MFTAVDSSLAHIISFAEKLISNGEGTTFHGAHASNFDGFFFK